MGKRPDGPAVVGLQNVHELGFQVREIQRLFFGGSSIELGTRLTMYDPNWLHGLPSKLGLRKPELNLGLQVLGAHLDAVGGSPHVVDHHVHEQILTVHIGLQLVQFLGLHWFRENPLPLLAHQLDVRWIFAAQLIKIASAEPGILQVSKWLP